MRSGSSGRSNQIRLAGQAALAARCAAAAVLAQQAPAAAAPAVHEGVGTRWRIPPPMIDHVEVLGDGPWSIYGSDAMAGVVNIITGKKLEGVEVSGYPGEFSKGGRTTEASLTAGGSSGKFAGLFVASFYNQETI